VQYPSKRTSGELCFLLTETGSKIAFVMQDFLEVLMDEVRFEEGGRAIHMRADRPARNMPSGSWVEKEPFHN
jgi:hypothetical protein